jgi:electron transport complex protein RnfD
LFATIIVKMLFGGLGKNFANPAITARIFVVLAWGAVMNRYVPTINLSQGFGEMFKYFGMSGAEINSIASATPLAALKTGDVAGVNILDMFLGRIAGALAK